jgi:hypothetical protein
VWHGIESFADDKPPWFVLHDYARLCVQVCWREKRKKNVFVSPLAQFRSSYYHLQLDDD